MKTTSSNYSKTGHIPQLDGIRGVALLLVLFSHYFNFKTIFAAGWCGVDLFFVLSGFLITNRLLNAYKKPYYFSRFYRNRFLRIVPLYFSVLLIFYAGIHFFAKTTTQNILEIYTTHWKSFFLFFENWTFILHGVPNAAYLLHFWSLAVEEQFYLVWPLLLYILPSLRLRIKIYLLLIFLVMVTRFFIYQQHSGPGGFPYYYFNTFCRIDSFIIGGLFSEIEFNKVKLRLNFVYIIILFCFTCVLISLLIYKNVYFANPFFGTIGYTIIAFLFAAIIYLSKIRFNAPINFLLRNRMLTYIGKISYGLYVFHVPVLFILKDRIHEKLMQYISSPILLLYLPVLICLVLTFIISAFSFRYFESHFLRLKK